MPHSSYDDADMKYFIDTYADMIARIACTNLKSQSDVQDILQDVLIKLLERREAFTDKSHEKAWIIRVTINACRDYNKSFWRSHVDLRDEPFIKIEERMEHGEILEAVRRIPPKYGNVIYLYYYEGYSTAEISALLGKKQNTILSLLRRGRLLLKQFLEGDDSINI